MPALPNVPKVIRVIYEQSLGADFAAINHEYWQYPGVLSPADLAAWLIDVGNFWGTDLSGEFSPAQSLTAIHAIDLTTPTSPDVTHIVTHIGTRAGGGLPAQVCALENLLIGRRYRGGKPRIYWPFGTETDVQTVDTWFPASVTSFNNALAAFRAGIKAAAPAAMGTPVMVNVSYYAGFTNFVGVTGRSRPRSTVRAVPLVDIVSDTSINGHLATQRRRTLIRH
jgi:hypothetical protein